MKSRKCLNVLLVSGVALSAAQVLAHTKLDSAVPADGAVLREAPATLELGFSENVQLLKLDIMTDDEVAQDIGFTPDATAAKTFSIQLPPMEPEAYLVNWTAIGADGHRVEGSLSFLVDQTAHEPADAESENEESEEDAD